RRRPLRLKDELRRGAKEEEGLPDEVRAFRSGVRAVVKGFSGEAFAVHFRDPVDLVAYPNYVEVVAEPMDLSTILFKLRSGEYDSREGRNLLLRDINLIDENCKTFNGRGVLISQNAHLVARTFIGYLDEKGFGGGGGGGGAFM
ncbi:unnamed protein product, partial [Laminaria digitata]